MGFSCLARALHFILVKGLCVMVANFVDDFTLSAKDIAALDAVGA